MLQLEYHSQSVAQKRYSIKPYRGSTGSVWCVMQWPNVTLCSLCLFHVGVVIGFQQTVYEFQENAGFAIVRFGILQRALRIPIVVSFSLSPGTAMGEEK